MKISDPIITQFRENMLHIYGKRLKHLILYGSRARGDNRPNSDYDFALVIKNIYDDLSTRVYEAKKIGAGLPEELWKFVHPIVFSENIYYHRQSPLMNTIRLEGLDLL